MKRGSGAFRINKRMAEQLWGRLSPQLLASLRGLTSTYGLSIGRGDIICIDGRWYVTHAGLVTVVISTWLFGNARRDCLQLLRSIQDVRTRRVRKQKTDRQDAQLILRLLLEDRFPQIWVPSWENRDLRQLLWHRHRMVQARTRIMNQLQAVALNEGLRCENALLKDGNKSNRIDPRNPVGSVARQSTQAGSNMAKRACECCWTEPAVI